MITGCGRGRAFAAFCLPRSVKGLALGLRLGANRGDLDPHKAALVSAPTSGASRFVRCGQVSAWPVGYTVGYTGSDA
jgi:hypothetical protein